MKSCQINRIGRLICAVAWLCCATASQAQAESSPMYRCPGDLYTNSLTPKEARDKGCRTLEGSPVTVIPATKRPVAAGGDPAVQPKSANRIDPELQRARDSDARRILEAELRREEDRLADLRKEYNAGAPERQGNERNYQKYLDRTAELKSVITRKEADIAAIKRELAKVPQ